jgi:hypothetical protein
MDRQNFIVLSAVYRLGFAAVSMFAALPAHAAFSALP